MKNIRLVVASLLAFTVGIFSVSPNTASALDDMPASPVMAILEPVTQPVQTILDPSVPQTPVVPTPTLPTNPTQNTPQPTEPAAPANTMQPVQYGMPLPLQPASGVAIANTAAYTNGLQGASTQTSVADTVATAQTVYPGDKTSQNDRVSIAIIATIIGIILLAAGYVVRRRYEIRGVTS